MKIEVKRDYFTPTVTLGKLYIDGVYQCETLEDCDRNLEDGGKKIQNSTAIPRGSYEVVINHSTRFDKDMPLLLDVPQFSGVRIHAGNTSSNTEGCILLGLKRDQDEEMITSSRLAVDAFMEKLQSAIRVKDKVIIEIA